KRMECVELAPAFEPRYTSDTGSKLHALHTLRAIWFRLSRAEDRRALSLRLAIRTQRSIVGCRPAPRSWARCRGRKRRILSVGRLDKYVVAPHPVIFEPADRRRDGFAIGVAVVVERPALAPFGP